MTSHNLGIDTGAGELANLPEVRRYTQRMRRTEMGLLVCAMVVVSVALILVQYSQQQYLGRDVPIFLSAFFAAFSVTHVVLRWRLPYADPLILPCVALLNGLGLVIIHRLDLVRQEAALFNNQPLPQAEAMRQVIWTFAGVLLFSLVVFFLKDYRLLGRYSYTLGLIGILFLATPAILPGRFSEVNGAKIWIRLPFLSIQPAEFSKILILIFIASVLVTKRQLFSTLGKQFLGMDFPRARDLAPIIAVWGFAVLILVFEKDLGTSLLIFVTILIMIYIATNRISWLIIGLASFAFAATVAYFVFAHVRVRVETWLDPFGHYATLGYQLSQAQLSLGTGGLGGTGLGNGRPDLVPLASSDFIISSIGEELGLFGITAVLLLYAVIVMRGMKTSLAVRDSFGKLLAAGLAFSLALQVFVICGGVARLIPLTGLTTPFLSYGGSSLLSNYVLIALLLHISHIARRPTPQPLRRPVVVSQPPSSLSGAPA